MNEKEIEKVINILEEEFPKWNVPIVTLIGVQENNPFKVLLSTIISLRTKDEVTIQSSRNLFKILEKPEDVYKISVEDIKNAIYPAGFYKEKSERIHENSKIIAERFNGYTPENLDELLSLKGVGRKTANLVLSEGFGKPSICVDTHVHRISNRLNVVSTSSPEETEQELKKILPKKYWSRYNTLMVAFGQYICRPVSPHCSKCPIEKLCPKKGVEKSR